MAELEDDVQCALALIQTSIKHHGPEDKLVIGCKKCAPVTQALRGHKFLKDGGFVTATIRVGTFVSEPHRNLAEVLEAIKRQYNVTPRMPLFAVSATGRRSSTHDESSTRRGSTASSSSGHTSERGGTRGGTTPLATPRTRVRVQRGEPYVLPVSSSSEESSAAEEHIYTHPYSTFDSRYRSTSAPSDEEADLDSMDSTEIMNTTDVRADGSEDDEDMTGVNQRSAEKFSVSGRFSLQEQRLVSGFNARNGQHGDVMMTIKLFGATVPVPTNTIVFQPLFD
jgi:hypothetical protein